MEVSKQFIALVKFIGIFLLTNRVRRPGIYRFTRAKSMRWIASEDHGFVPNSNYATCSSINSPDVASRHQTRMIQKWKQLESLESACWTRELNLINSSRLNSHRATTPSRANLCVGNVDELNEFEIEFSRSWTGCLQCRVNFAAEFHLHFEQSSNLNQAPRSRKRLEVMRQFAGPF